jgi:cytochrome P450
MLVYSYHMLSKHSKCLNKLRKEHDEVFGRDPADAAGLLKNTPSLLNNCKLTLAFLKEMLRLYAPSGTIRAGLPDMAVTNL